MLIGMPEIHSCALCSTRRNMVLSGPCSLVDANVKRFVTNFSRGVFGRARRYLDWLRCVALHFVVCFLLCCVVLCCDVMLCVVMSLTCYSSLLA